MCSDNLRLCSDEGLFVQWQKFHEVVATKNTINLPKCSHCILMFLVTRKPNSRNTLDTFSAKLMYNRQTKVTVTDSADSTKVPRERLFWRYIANTWHLTGERTKWVNGMFRQLMDKLIILTLVQCFSNCLVIWVTVAVLLMLLTIINKS